MNEILFLLFAFFTVYLSIKLSYYVDYLNKSSNINGVILGAILLAGVTSLPELASRGWSHESNTSSTSTSTATTLTSATSETTTSTTSETSTKTETAKTTTEQTSTETTTETTIFHPYIFQIQTISVFMKSLKKVYFTS